MPRSSAMRDNSAMNSTPPSERDLDLGCIWNNSFAKLGNDFYTRLLPQPLPAPYWIGHSCALARKLGLAEHWLASQELLQGLSGNRMINGTQPLASVYSCLL